MTECPTCHRLNVGFVYEENGEYRFSGCGHPIPVEPKPVYKTMQDHFREAGGFRYLEKQVA